jgi:hypothetical protein
MPAGLRTALAQAFPGRRLGVKAGRRRFAGVGGCLRVSAAVMYMTLAGLDAVP